MKMHLSKNAKTLIKEERAKILERMSEPDIGQDKWDDLHSRYRAYTEMLKPTWTVTPDTTLVVAGNLLGIVLMLYFEKSDIIRSAVKSFVLKARV